MSGKDLLPDSAHRHEQGPEEFSSGPVFCFLKQKVLYSSRSHLDTENDMKAALASAVAVTALLLATPAAHAGSNPLKNPCPPGFSQTILRLNGQSNGSKL